MEYQDITIQCLSCGREFIFTAREQEFFANKGFKEPRHCRECRQKRKQERESTIARAMPQTLPSGREVYQVTCAQCHRETFVPFRPITGKPVLCKDCFIAVRYGTTEGGDKADSQKLPEAEPEPIPPEPTAVDAERPELEKTPALTEPDSAIVTTETDASPEPTTTEPAEVLPEPEIADEAETPAK